MNQAQTGRARTIRVPLPSCRSGIGPGTGVLTAEGEIPAEFLNPGDRIVTHDAGMQVLSGVMTRKVPAREVIRVAPAEIDPEGRGRAFLISAGQRILLRDWRARAIFGQPQALVEAARLEDGAFFAPLTGDAPVTLFQLMFKTGQHIVYLDEMRLMAASARLPVAARP